VTESRRRFLRIAGLAALGSAGASLGRRRAARAEATAAVAASAGPRWAMAIDLGACASEGADCDRCFRACHAAHNVPDFEANPRLDRDALYGNSPRHAVRWIWRTGYDNAFHGQTHAYVASAAIRTGVPVLCNHCESPPCVRACPTQATWRRSDGIVMMDMHRCIGCRYCIAACPYGARSFNLRDPRIAFREDPRDPRSPMTLPSPSYPTRTRGVVEKCSFCAELPEGDRESRRPYCARACPRGAILFGDIHAPGSELRRALGERFTVQRAPSLGTNPHVFYIV